MTTRQANHLVSIALQQATHKHPPFPSTHHGYAAILEELDELWDHVTQRSPSPSALKTEATHVAAMAIRFLIDLCE